MLGLVKHLVVVTALARIAAGSASPLVASYWPAYSSNIQSPDEIPWTSSNIMLYFVTVTLENGFKIPDGQSIDDVKSFVTNARANNVKPIFTVGGWTGSQHFSTLIATARSRQAFAHALKAFNDDWGFAGVDLDYEYPGETGIGTNNPNPDADTPNFLLLLQELRAVFGRDKLITAAVSMKGFSRNGVVLDDLSPFAQYLDYIMIMAYDVSGPWSDKTGPLAPLRACSSALGVDTSIEAWTSRGFPASQILLGVPSYAISFGTESSQLTNSTTVAGGFSTRLYNAKTSRVPKGDSSDTGGGSASFSGQWKMQNLISEGILSEDETTGLNGYDRFWDECSATPFLFNPDKRVLISYDDSASIRQKAQYAMSQGLAGVMIFDTLGFTPAVYRSLKEGLGVDQADESARVATAAAVSSVATSSTVSRVPAPLSSFVVVVAAPGSSTAVSVASRTNSHPTASSPSANPASSTPLSSASPSESTGRPYIQCESTGTWSFCTSDGSCETMGDVAPGTTCQEGKIAYAEEKRRSRFARRAVSGGSARFATGHKWTLV